MRHEFDSRTPHRKTMEWYNWLFLLPLLILIVYFLWWELIWGWVIVFLPNKKEKEKDYITYK